MFYGFLLSLDTFSMLKTIFDIIEFLAHLGPANSLTCDIRDGLIDIVDRDQGDYTYYIDPNTEGRFSGGIAA